MLYHWSLGNNEERSLEHTQKLGLTPINPQRYIYHNRSTLSTSILAERNAVVTQLALTFPLLTLIIAAITTP
jgi:hypothetical protein